jgi:hypothetical protein
LKTTVFVSVLIGFLLGCVVMSKAWTLFSPGAQGTVIEQLDRAKPGDAVVLKNGKIRIVIGRNLAGSMRLAEVTTSEMSPPEFLASNVGEVIPNGHARYHGALLAAR